MFSGLINGLSFYASILLAAAVLCAESRALPSLDSAPSPACARIVSLAPSITELLYDLNLGSNVIGVTSYCIHPAEARRKPKVGGLLDLSYEAVLSLRPTVVFALAEEAPQVAGLQKLGLEAVMLEHRSVSGILESVSAVGKICGREREAGALRASLEERVQRVQGKTRGRPKVRTLVIVGSGMAAGSASGLYVSGRDGFYSELLELAGGVNVYQGLTAGAPALSAEGLLSLNPDVIIEISTEPGAAGRERFPAGLFGRLSAVQKGRIYRLHEDYASVPGPRFVLILEKLAAFLHPESFNGR